MNQQELEKHLFFHIAFYVFLAFTIGFTIFWLLTDNVSADTGYTTLDITTSIRDTTRCTTAVGSGYFCSALTTQSTWVSTQTRTNNLGYYPLSFEFSYQNNNMQTLTNSTIALISYDNQFKNISYSCTISNVSDCRVVYSNSSRLNINFTTPSNTNTMTIFITANGTNIARGDYFGIKEIRFIQPKNTDSTNTDIIQSNVENTEKVIDNNNKNTQDIIQQVQDIIANNEELTQQMIQAQSCPSGPLAIVRDSWTYISNTYLDSSGNQISSSGYSVSPYVDILPNTRYDITLSGQYNAPSLCFYTSKSTNQSNSLITCEQYSRRREFYVVSPSNAEYMLLSFNTTGGVTVKGPVCNDWQKEAQDKLNDIGLDTNNYLKDNSNPTVDNSGIQNTISSVNQTNPLQYFLTLPTTLINATITGLSSNSCTDWKIGRFGTIGRHDLSGYEFKFPCVNIRDKIGDNIYLIIDAFVAIGILVGTVVKLYHTVSNYITLGAEDEVRAQSSFLSPMDFLGNVLGGNAGGVISHLKE